MSLKPFVQLAKALRAVKPTESLGKLIQWKDDVLAVCDVLEKSNPRFNRTVFLEACDINLTS